LFVLTQCCDFVLSNDSLSLDADSHLNRRCMTDALVDACLDWAGENPEQRQHIPTVLNRATRSEHGAKAGRAEAQLDRLVKTRCIRVPVQGLDTGLGIGL
jgi:hypothetical protein